MTGTSLETILQTYYWLCWGSYLIYLFWCNLRSRLIYFWWSQVKLTEECLPLNINIIAVRWVIYHNNIGPHLLIIISGLTLSQSPLILNQFLRYALWLLETWYPLPTNTCLLLIDLFPAMKKSLYNYVEKYIWKKCWVLERHWVQISRQEREVIIN